MADNLRDLREKAGVTQYELARISGVDRSKISLYENKHISIDDAQVQALEAALVLAIQERAKRFTGMAREVASNRSDFVLTHARA